MKKKYIIIIHNKKRPASFWRPGHTVQQGTPNGSSGSKYHFDSDPPNRISCIFGDRTNSMGAVTDWTVFVAFPDITK